jgi:hypothetical protein
LIWSCFFPNSDYIVALCKDNYHLCRPRYSTFMVTGHVLDSIFRAGDICRLSLYHCSSIVSEFNSRRLLTQRYKHILASSFEIISGPKSSTEPLCATLQIYSQTTTTTKSQLWQYSVPITISLFLKSNLQRYCFWMWFLNNSYIEVHLIFIISSVKFLS